MCAIMLKPYFSLWIHLTIGVFLATFVWKLSFRYQTSVFNDETCVKANIKWRLKPLHSNQLKVDHNSLIGKCASKLPKATIAYQKATTDQCRNLIEQTSCQFLNGSLNSFQFESSCTAQQDKFGQHLGCYRDNQEPFLYANYSIQLSNQSNYWDFCAQNCLKYSFLMFAIENGNTCFCLDKIDAHLKVDSRFCSMLCPGSKHHSCGGYLTANVYRTGVLRTHLKQARASQSGRSIAIAFLLFLSGRNVHQTLALIDNIYRPHHLYYVHVDLQCDYLVGELKRHLKNKPNIHIANKRFDTIWGGSHLLSAFLHALSESLQIDSNWDYAINLSESDFLLQPMQVLERFLSNHDAANFVRYHSMSNSKRFIDKQGLQKLFVQCDRRMWLLADRPLPSRISFTGGSDWFVLTRPFAHYLTDPHNRFVLDLTRFYGNVLLPVESFVHTVLDNSPFCTGTVNNNLKLTNWNRSLGCRCQHKHTVDWCGCSPNVFRHTDQHVAKIKQAITAHRYFGRKFDSTIDRSILRLIEIDFLNLNSSHFEKSSFVNIYSHGDHAEQFADHDSFALASILKVFALLLFAHLKARNLIDKNVLVDQWSAQVQPLQAFHLKDHNWNDLIWIDYWNVAGAHTASILVHSSPATLSSAAAQTDLPITIDQLSICDRVDAKEDLLSAGPCLLHARSALFVSIRVSAGASCGPGHEHRIEFNWIDPAAVQRVHSSIIKCNQIRQKSKIRLFYRFEQPASLSGGSSLQPGLWKVQASLVNGPAIYQSFLVYPYWTSMLSMDPHLQSSVLDHQSMCAHVSAFQCRINMYLWMRRMRTFWNVNHVCIADQSNSTCAPEHFAPAH